MKINPIWNNEQQKVLDSTGSIIVTGIAGSGKTLLAIHKAIQLANTRNVAIVVYTEALKSFIQNYLSLSGNFKIDVLLKQQIFNALNSKYDALIIDEYQDFSIYEINKIRQKVTEILIFGDDNQRLYIVDYDKIHPTTNIKELVNNLKLPIFRLNDSYRLTEENLVFVDQLIKRKSMEPSKNKGPKPRVKHFESVEEELQSITHLLISNKVYKNIGILLKYNKTYTGGYFYKKEVRGEVVYGIEDTVKYLEEKGVKVGYRCTNQNNLNFSKEININVMTIHSAKGLEFDLVILPFTNYISDIGQYTMNVFYVAWTRASKRLIITYSGNIAPEFTKIRDGSCFTGEIVMNCESDQPDIITKQDEKISNEIDKYPYFKFN